MPTMLDGIKLYVTSVLKAMELKDPVEDAVVLKLVDAIFTNAIDSLIDTKIPFDQRQAYADRLIELLKNQDQIGYVEHVKVLGMNEEIGRQVMAEANDMIMKLIDQLQADGYVTEDNIAKLQAYIANPTELIEFDKIANASSPI